MALCIAYLFFESLIAYICLMPMSILYMNYIKKHLICKRKRELKLQFCEALEAVKVLLKAGNSIEYSFEKVIDELKHMQCENSYMVKEVLHINNCIKLDIAIEKLILDFADRANILEINNFADVFIISKRADGNVIKIIETTCNFIRNNINMNRQIRMSISGVLQEITIMRIMPLGILIYLKVFSKGYFDLVHESILGQSIMIVILIVYIVACAVIEYMQRKVFNEIC